MYEKLLNEFMYKEHLYPLREVNNIKECKNMFICPDVCMKSF